MVINPNPQANTATINHADQFDPNTANNSDTASINPQQADLSLGKIVSSARPNVGDVITFTVTLTNNGPAGATNVSVMDLLPAGLTFVAGATPSQGTYVPATGIWTVGNLANGASATLPLQARVVNSAAQTNTATIGHADQFDPNTGNNSDSATETPQHADLALTKSVDNARPNVGDIVIFTIDLHNAGPDAATHVVVNDPLPAGLSLQTSRPSQGTYVGGVWTVGTVTPGVAQTLTLTALVVSPNAQTNTATIGHSDQFDPVTTNNSASATETPQQADLALTKTVSPTAPNVGDTVTYVVTLTNKGPDTATDVRVTDLLPASLTFISATPSVGAYDSVGGLWTIASLANAGQATLTLNAVVAIPTPQTNTATITGADQFDPDKTNNSAGATETPQQADLVVAKSVSNPTPNVGDIVTFTIQLTNRGPNTATNVAISDDLPVGLTFVSAAPSQGTYSSATGFWTVGTVTTALAPTLQIQGRVASPLAQTNTATIFSADQFDPNTENNADSATETPQQADLAVTKTVNNPTPNVGDTIDYTITLTNRGVNSATNVTLQDLLPAGLTFVTATPSVGSYNPTSGIWTVGTVTTTTPQTLLLFAQVVSPLPTTNTAAIIHADQFDPSLGNNQASVTETPQQADLHLAKTVDNPRPRVGDTITYTVTLTNLGPNTATSVVVRDTLPAGLTFVSATPSQGTYDPGTGIWTVGTVAPGSAPTLRLRATVTSATPVTNTAGITDVDQFDPDGTNNAGSATVLPLIPTADLILAKTVSPAQVFLGSNVSYTLIIRNLGPDTATGVTVTDPIPAGLVFVSATASQGTYDPNTGIWTVGILNNGVSATLKVTAQVMTVGTVVNTASAGAAQLDPDTANNLSSATVIGLNPTSSISKRSFLASSGIPTLAGPSGEITTLTPTFAWNPPVTVSSYEFWLSDLTTGQAPLFDVANITSMSFTPTSPLTAGHTYEWWVKGLAWSSPDIFSIPAVAPKLTSPSGSIASAVPSFAWSPATGASSYELWLSDLTTGQAPLLDVANITNTSYTPAGALTVGHTYEWWVKALSGAARRRSRFSCPLRRPRHPPVRFQRLRDLHLERGGERRRLRYLGRRHHDGPVPGLAEYAGCRNVVHGAQPVPARRHLQLVGALDQQRRRHEHVGRRSRLHDQSSHCAHARQFPADDRADAHADV